MPARNAARAVGIHDRPVRALDPATHPLQRITPCPVCDEERASPRFELQDFASRVFVCSRCGLGRFQPLPGPEEVRAMYPDEYYGEPGSKFQPLVERLVRLVGERHVGFLCRGVPPGGRVLDMGCGRGVILGALTDRGFEAHGVEISAEAARGADPRAEIRIAPRLADADYADSSFDQIIVWHVLEHLADPRGTILEMNRILKPGGRLIVAVPNFSSPQARWTGAAWFHLDLPRHLYHFPVSALRTLLVRSGFEVMSEHHFSLRQNPFGWIQSLLNQRGSFPRNALYTLLHRRARGEAPPFDARTRLRLWLWLLVTAPVALAAAVAEALFRQGATVHLVARKVGPPRVPARGAPSRPALPRHRG